MWIHIRDAEMRDHTLVIRLHSRMKQKNSEKYSNWTEWEPTFLVCAWPMNVNLHKNVSLISETIEQCESSIPARFRYGTYSSSNKKIVSFFLSLIEVLHSFHTISKSCNNPTISFSISLSRKLSNVELTECVHKKIRLSPFDRKEYGETRTDAP
jgi:hypothetical protein